jgi:hypothetical protein
MKELGWEAWKTCTGGIMMRKRDDHWITNPLCAVCSEVGPIAVSSANDATRELKIGPRVAEWIVGAMEYPSDMLRADHDIRCRRDLLEALKLKKDR